MQRDTPTGSQTLGFVIIFLTGPMLAAVYWMTGGFGWPLPLLFTIAAVGGAVGMALLAPRRIRLPGMVCGILMGLGSFGLHLFYASFRTRMSTGETVLVGIVGALPGILLYAGVRKLAMRRLTAAQGQDIQAAQDLAEIQSDPVFDVNAEQRKAALADLLMRVKFIGFILLIAALLLEGVLLMLSISSFQDAHAHPGYKDVTYAQFLQVKPHTGSYRIKDCSIDLGEAAYTDPPDPQTHPGPIYLPIHAGDGSEEKETQIVIALDRIYHQNIETLLEAAKSLKSLPLAEGADKGDTEGKRFLLTLELQGDLENRTSVPQGLSSELRASCRPPLNADFVLLEESHAPSLLWSITGAVSSILLILITLIPFVKLFRWIRKEKVLSRMTS